MTNSGAASLILDGTSLTIPDLVRAARDPSVVIQVQKGALKEVRNCRKIIDDAVKKYAASYPNVTNDDLMYGVTSGFGEFKTIAIHPDHLVTLQENLLLSHAAGVGDNADWLDPRNYFCAQVVRAAMVVRLNAFLRGRSGVRDSLVLVLQAMLNAGIVPLVPTKGSVGSSGDLCPLAHLFVVLLGKGFFYVVGREPASSSSSARIPWMLNGGPTSLLPAEELWTELESAPVDAEVQEAIQSVREQPVSNKEGLALTNGATFCAAMLALAVFDAETLANSADLSSALTMEAMCSRLRFLDEEVHRARGMTGQRHSAENIRTVLQKTRLCEWTDDVQESYSIRCAPQVHGASRDAIAYAKMVVSAEINAATDNPLFFPGHEPFGIDLRRSRDEQKDGLGNRVAISAGNFHGQPLALAADFLAIGVAELANIAERRIQLLLDKDHNRHLPPNLTAMPGVDSGLMLVQYTAASLVSENKVLTHPASVDSIPTAANREDHVSMATLATRKAMQVVQNSSAVLAIEFIASAQAVDWRTCLLDDDDKDRDAANYYAIDPNKKRKEWLQAEQDPGSVQARADHRRRQFEESKPAGRPSDRTMRSLGVGTGAAYAAIRDRVSPLHRDMVLEPVIRTVRTMLLPDGILIDVANAALRSAAKNPLRAISALTNVTD